MKLTKQEAALVHIALMDLRRKVEDRIYNCEEERIPHYQNQLWQIEAVLLKLEKNENECIKECTITVE